MEIRATDNVIRSRRWLCIVADSSSVSMQGTLLAIDRVNNWHFFKGTVCDFVQFFPDGSRKMGTTIGFNTPVDFRTSCQTESYNFGRGMGVQQKSRTFHATRRGNSHAREQNFLFR